jgi:LmbE family N-acetylglucosaminyl deacetylase
MRVGDALSAMQALPLRDLDAIVGTGGILVLAPHPDDESLGCGGLIAQACAGGRDIDIAVLTDGAGSHPGAPPARVAALRAAEVRAAVAALGLAADRLHMLGLPDTAAPHDGPGLLQAAWRVADLARGRTILATWRHDPHCDHEAAHLIAAEAARLTGTRLVSYPIWGWTLPPEKSLPARPIIGARLDVSGQLPAKRAAIAAHRSQLTGTVDGDPDGFSLPTAFLALFDRPFETFLFDPD